jgi:hypothetical protein
MTDYVAHYNAARPHRAIKLDAPIPLRRQPTPAKLSTALIGSAV